MATYVAVLLGGLELILGAGVFTVFRFHKMDVPLIWDELTRVTCLGIGWSGSPSIPIELCAVAVERMEGCPCLGGIPDTEWGVRNNIGRIAVWAVLGIHDALRAHMHSKHRLGKANTETGNSPYFQNLLPTFPKGYKGLAY
eukprot:1140938-Pelagomonas_calceolata.AAC.2